ncbi:BQ2448_3776 [Microbotryum intermedium]|uniref:chitin synthase n=1 Tax=Microbotryum intermedium TaxID=269621 RepID=A0A238FGK5_9BASI|nr:BQ2448_3776 [Microbotryum intermedium]
MSQDRIPPRTTSSSYHDAHPSQPRPFYHHDDAASSYGVDNRSPPRAAAASPTLGRQQDHTFPPPDPLAQPSRRPILAQMNSYQDPYYQVPAPALDPSSHSAIDLCDPYYYHMERDVDDDQACSAQNPHHSTYPASSVYQDSSYAQTNSHTALNLQSEKDGFYQHSYPSPKGFQQQALSPISPTTGGVGGFRHVPWQAPAPVGPTYIPATHYIPGAGGVLGNYHNNGGGAFQQERMRVMQRRGRKKIALVDGHLVMDLPVPKSIQQFNKYRGEDMSQESGKMRYTAVTDDPDDFTRQRYRLRQVQYGRQTELFICLTMYNEDEQLFCRTFTAVIKNIQMLQERQKSKTWGTQSWKKIVVCIVSDGRAKINPRTLKILGLYGCFQDGIAKDTIDKKDVEAHLFEYTTQVVVDKDGQVLGGISPIQILFCLKEQNKKKLNSHRWAFNAFCHQLRPNVCVLLDVGTRPGGSSIYHLWKEFDKHSGIGGACGEITVDTGRGCGNLLNPLVAAQNFEYKMSNILDKPLESVFGFISVLPGAFSAYRYKALLGEPLRVYFLGEKMHAPGNVASLSDSNMYLAEDRLLCMEITCKKNEAWTLKYVKSAKASTDTPNTLPEFLGQRRRWLNGAFFASLHSSLHYYRVWTSGQGFFRKLWLSVIYLYNFIQLLFQTIGLSSFYLAFLFLCNSATSDPGHDGFGGYGSDVISVANSVYIATLGITIVCALGNKPAGSKWLYVAVMTSFAVLFGSECSKQPSLESPDVHQERLPFLTVALYCTAWTIYLSVPHTLAGWKHIDELLQQSGFRNIVISLAATYGMYLISSILHYDPWHLFTVTRHLLIFCDSIWDFVRSMFLLPSFISVLTIYSFANLHDIHSVSQLAWGTKGSTVIKDLGHAAKTKDKDGQEVVEVDIPTAPDDIDALWIQMRKEMSHPVIETHTKRTIDQKQADRFAVLRTNVLMSYLGINLALVIGFTSKFWTNFLARESKDGVVINYYMVGIFWAVAALSAFRLIGSTLYLVLRMVGF